MADNDITEQAQATQEMQGVDMPSAQSANPYDPSPDIQELEGIQKELKDIEQSIENDFANHIVALLENDPVFEELFFNDRTTFFKKVIEEQNKFVTALVEPKNNRIQELSNNINQKQQLGAMDEARKAFQEQNPDVDIQELMIFFTQELPPKIQEEIKNAPIEEFFNIIYGLFMQSKAPMPQEQAADQELPSQANGVPISNENEVNQGLPMGRQ